MIDIPIDFSALSTLHCGRAYQLSCVRGIDSSSDATNLGSAIHKFLEYRALGNTTPAVELGMELGSFYKLPPPLISKLILTVSQLQHKVTFGEIAKDTLGNPLVEYKFSIPYLTIGNFNIILAGTIDILDTRLNALAFTDYKTTACVKASADKIISEYQSSFQLPFYMYVIHKFLHKFLPEPLASMARENRMFGQYKMIFHSLTPLKVEDQSPVYLTESTINNIESLLSLLIAKAINIHNTTTLYPPEGAFFKKCPSCSFYQYCAINDPVRMLELINSQPTRKYDPTNFR